MHDAPTSLANFSAIAFSSHIITALTSFCHVASESFAIQWLISACNRPSTSDALASMVEVALAFFKPLASFFYLAGGNWCFDSRNNASSAFNSRKKTTLYSNHNCTKKPTHQFGIQQLAVIALVMVVVELLLLLQKKKDAQSVHVLFMIIDEDISWGYGAILHD